MNPDIMLTIGAENLADQTFQEILNMLQALSRQINMLQGEELGLAQTTDNLRQAGARLALDSSVNMPQLMSKISQVTDALGQFEVRMEDVSGGIHRAAGTGGADFNKIIKNVFPNPKDIQSYLKNFVLDIAGSTLQFDTGATAPSGHTFSIGGRTTSVGASGRTERQLMKKFEGVRQDCVVRAMSIGLGLAYEDLHAQLQKAQRMNPKNSQLYKNLQSRSRTPDLGIADFDYEPLLEAAGFRNLKVADKSKISRRYKGPQFQDLVNELVQTEVGRNLSLIVGSPKHTAAIKAGSLHDAWDSTKEPISDIFIREQDLNLPEVKKALENIARKVGKSLQDIVDAGKFISEESFAGYEEFRGIHTRKLQEAQKFLQAAPRATSALGSGPQAPILQQTAQENTRSAQNMTAASKSIQSGASDIQQSAADLRQAAREIRGAIGDLRGAGMTDTSNKGQAIQFTTMEQKTDEVLRRMNLGEEVGKIIKETRINEGEVRGIVENTVFSAIEKQSKQWIEERTGKVSAEDVFKELGFGKFNLSAQQKEIMLGMGVYRHATPEERRKEAEDEAISAMAKKMEDFSLSDEQRVIVDTPLGQKMIDVTAGPGAGKTQMSVEIIKKMVENLKGQGFEGTELFSRIMAITHQKEAAGELKKRLTEEFGEEMVDFMRIGTMHSVALEMMSKNLSPQQRNYHAFIKWAEESGWANIRQKTLEKARGLCEGPG